MNAEHRSHHRILVATADLSLLNPENSAQNVATEGRVDK